jgi:hypothetical protein
MICRLAVMSVIAVAILFGGVVVARLLDVRTSATAVQRDLDALATEVSAGHLDRAVSRSGELERSTQHLASIVSDPLWKGLSALPWVGRDAIAVTELATAGHAVAASVVGPVLGALSDERAGLTPSDGAIDPASLSRTTGVLVDAVSEFDDALARLERAPSPRLAPIAEQMDSARLLLSEAHGSFVAAADVARAVDGVAGEQGPRTVLVLLLTPAELRAGGGIAGAGAQIRVEHGGFSLERIASDGEIGPFDEPVAALDADSAAAWGDRTGRWWQNVTMTPRFPVTATIAREMWQRTFDVEADAVVSVDPVVLSALLKATGPVRLTSGDEIRADDIERVLEQGVYGEHEDPRVQDAYFADVVSSMFDALRTRNLDPVVTFRAVAEPLRDGHLRFWSAEARKQAAVSGGVLGGDHTASTGGTRFGVHLNDATGAKMGPYLERRVDVQNTTCDVDGRSARRVVVELANTATDEVIGSLSEYVTGGGHHGVAVGSIATLVHVVAPEHAVFTAATRGGAAVPVRTTQDEAHAVVSSAVELAPGESAVIAFEFVVDASSTELTTVETPGVRWHGRPAGIPQTSHAAC